LTALCLIEGVLVFLRLYSFYFTN